MLVVLVELVLLVVSCVGCLGCVARASLVGCVGCVVLIVLVVVVVLVAVGASLSALHRYFQDKPCSSELPHCCSEWMKLTNFRLRGHDVLLHVFFICWTFSTFAGCLHALGSILAFRSSNFASNRMH